MHRRKHISGLLFSLALAIMGPSARAQSVAEFFRGKSIALVIPNAPGGSFDLYGRLVARHLGRHLPGQPVLIPQNMPGASGLIAGNWLYGVAPQDGTAMSILIPNIAIAQVIGMPEIKYDVRRFNWVGRVVAPTATLFTWHTAATRSIADLRNHETVIASTGPLSQAEITSQMMNGLAKTRFKIIEGYKGTTDAILALERGEVEAGIFPWTFMKLSHPDWLAEHKVNVVAQYTRKPIADLPKVPSVFELADTADLRGVFTLFFGPDEIGQPLALPPNVPADRVEAIRHAFEEMIRDPEYLADAQKQQLALTPASWQELQASIAEAFKATPEQIAQARRFFH
jgi:tripartite-type tricarboxylate transporter receptor subunit TctC